MKNDLRCDECGHLRDNFDQARSCCTMQGSPCPDCERARRLKTGDEVRSMLRQQTGHIDRMDGDAAYVHWSDGSEQLCLLTDLTFTYTADPRD